MLLLVGVEVPNRIALTSVALGIKSAVLRIASIGIKASFSPAMTSVGHVTCGAKRTGRQKANVNRLRAGTRFGHAVSGGIRAV